MSDYVPGPLTTSSEKLGGGWEIRNANYAYNVILALLLTLFLVTVGGAGGSVSKSYDDACRRENAPITSVQN